MSSLSYWRRFRPARARRGLSCLATAALVGAAVTLPVAPAAADDPPRRILSGWLRPMPFQADGLADISATSDLWSDVSPFWYSASGATTITGTPDPAVVTALRERGIPVLPTVVTTLGTPAMETMLSDPAQRRAHRDRLVALVLDNGYTGVDLDYEAMNFGGTVAQKEHVGILFAAFLRELDAALNVHGKALSVAVGPQVSATDPSWAVFDYREIGAVVDRFKIMTYDFHFRGGQPGAVAPLPWVRQVLDYATGEVEPGRIQVGVPLYGYDWPVDAAGRAAGPATSVSTYDQVESLRTSVGAARQWSPADAAPYFTYTSGGVRHVVWYNDADSTMAKTRLVQEYRLRGVAFWHVSGTDDRQWPALRRFATPNTSSLTASGPALVVYGSPAVLNGRFLTGTGTPVAGATVRLQRRTTGPWGETGQTARTSASGGVSFTARPPGNGFYRLVTDGTSSAAAAASPTVSTGVQWRVSAAFTDDTIRLRSPAVLRGTVDPRRAGTRVERQRLVGNDWVLVSAATVSSSGAYSFTFTPTAKGRYVFRVRAPGTTTNVGNSSPHRALTVS